MGFMQRLFGTNQNQNNDCGCEKVTCRELFGELAECEVRDLCFQICVSIVANALSLCEFKTYSGGKESTGAEYWLWNYEPNANQNATEFIKQLVWHLYYDNEVLVFDPRKRNGGDALAVADSFTVTDYVSKLNEYTNVTCGNLSYNKTFREDDVLHLTLQNESVRKCLRKIVSSYEKVISAGMSRAEWDNGQHWKVHVSQIASQQNDFENKFTTLMKQQMKPFFKEGNTVLPEFDGYQYTRIGNEEATNSGTKEVRDMVEDIFNYTARAFLIPVVLINGNVEQTSDANERFLTYVIDPLAEQLQKEIIRKRYGFDEFRAGNYLKIDTSSIVHFDLFANAANVEKIVGSGCYTINDIRKSAGQVPINEPWAEKHYLTKNIGEVTALGE